MTDEENMKVINEVSSSILLEIRQRYVDGKRYGFYGSDFYIRYHNKIL